jgi:putative aminopeptidase FrvX
MRAVVNRNLSGDEVSPLPCGAFMRLRNQRHRLLAVAFVVFLASSAARAQDQTLELLQILTDAPGPPGFEEAIRKIMVERMTPLADKIAYDGLGSVIATQGSSGPRVMIDAHMDELGAVARRVTPDGFVTMQMLGGWLDEALVGQRWIIMGLKGPVRATSNVRDAHLAAAGDRDKLIDTRDRIFLDIGAKNAEEARQLGVAPGDPIVPDAPFAVLNGTQNYLGKAWDDRVGCAIILDVMRRLAKSPHPNQLFYAATVQEEIGLRGAHTSAEIVKPDVGIALEAGITKDVYGVHPEEAQEILGGGPGIFLYNSSQLPNRKFVALARQAAKEKSIPLQDEFVVGYGDDAAEIQKSNGGSPTITLVVPVRYTHVHNGIINRRDYDRTVELLVAIIQHLDAATVKQLRDFSSAP